MIWLLFCFRTVWAPQNNKYIFKYTVKKHRWSLQTWRASVRSGFQPRVVSVLQLGDDLAAFSCGRRAVGVAQHRVEGAGEVVGQGAAVVLFRQRHQAGQNQQHEEEQVQGEGSTEDPVEEGSVWGRIPPLLPGRQKLKIVTTVYFTAKPELMSS